MSRPRTPPLSRRQALAALGALGAGSAAACRKGWRPPEEDPTSIALAKPYVAGAEAYGTREERWFRSACGQCAAGCGIRVRVVEGRAVRIEGDRDNPLNQGGIGPRGLSGLQAVYDADRLTGPMKRIDGALTPISWDDALGELAASLAALRERGEPDRLLVWTGHERGLMYDLLERFSLAFGTPNFVDGRAGRSAVMTQAMAATTGVAEVPVYGWAHARYVLSLEAALIEDSCQSVYFTRVAAQLRRGAAERTRLVHAGASLDLCAYNADEWVRIRPGTSGALALGLARHLMEAHPEEATLPPSLVDGADGFRALVGPYTPDRVAELTGVEPRAVTRIAEELWAQRPALVFVDERSLAFTNGLDTARAALALNAVLGGFWQGGIGNAPALPLRDWPEVSVDAVATAGLARARLDGAERFARARSVHETLPEAIEAAGDRAPAIALLHHANPAYARQQPARWRRALDAIDLVVSFSPFLDETVAEVADLVLPDHTYLERWEAVEAAPALDRAVLTVRTPAIAPLHDTRATGDVVLDLARRLGAPVADALPWRSYRVAIEARLEGLRDVRRGNIRAISRHDFLAELLEVGHWVDDEPANPPVSKVVLPDRYEVPAWYGDAARFPLGLLPYRPLGYAEGSGANQPWLRLLRPRPDAQASTFAARVHPASAPGVEDGEEITLHSEWGSIRIPVVLDEWIEPGFVAIPLGGGHTASGRWARGFGVNVLDLVRPGPAADTGADLLCATRVRIGHGGES